MNFKVDNDWRENGFRVFLKSLGFDVKSKGLERLRSQMNRSRRIRFWPQPDFPSPPLLAPNPGQKVSRLEGEKRWGWEEDKERTLHIGLSPGFRMGMEMEG